MLLVIFSGAFPGAKQPTIADQLDNYGAATDAEEPAMSQEPEDAIEEPVTAKLIEEPQDLSSSRKSRFV